MGVLITILMIILTILAVVLRIVDIAGVPVCILFVILKLCGVIAWSWLMVFLPLIIWGSAIILTIIVGYIIAAIELD